MFGTSFGSNNNAATANPNNDLELPQPPSDAVSCLRWSPTANLLCAASWDKTVRVWQVELTGQVDLKFGHELQSPVLATDWAPVCLCRDQDFFDVVCDFFDL